MINTDVQERPCYILIQSNRMSTPGISMAVPSSADLTMPQVGSRCPWMLPLLDISHIYFHKWYEVTWLFPICSTNINLLCKAHCRHYWVNVDQVIIVHGLTEDSYLQSNTMLSGCDWLDSYLHGNTLLWLNCFKLVTYIHIGSSLVEKMTPFLCQGII